MIVQIYPDRILFIASSANL